MGCGGVAMRAGPGPLGRGDAVTLRVRAVGLRPDLPVLLLWGVPGERGAEYARLHREIQAAAGSRLAARPEPGGAAGGGAGLCPGEMALVEVLGLWYRCCVVSGGAQEYRVFLLDEGSVVATSAYFLARGCPELFQLPPEVLGCIVANVIPSQGSEGASGGDLPVSRWTVEAMEFLGALHGKEVSGVVQDVLSPQLLLLDLPQLVAQMQQLGQGRRVSAAWFCQVLKCCLPFGHLKKPLWQQAPAGVLGAFAVPQAFHTMLSYRPLLPALDYFYPQLQLGMTEPVLVTHVSDPHHIYCQLQCLSQEIRCLSDTISYVYNQWEQDLLPKVGSPCAARGMDGQWYRALLLELTAGEQDQQGAVVIFVDYGRKETVTRANLCHLPAECFRMPVVTYVCALEGVSDGGCGWSSSQIDVLKRLVQGRGVSAHIKAFNSFEHLYYVTLYGENGINLNHLYGSRACCLVSSHKQVSQTLAREQLELEESLAEELELPLEAPPAVLTHRDSASAALPGVHLKTCVFYSAQVSHLQDPSEFWLQLCEHHQLFRQLRQSMWNFYSHATKLDGDAWEPRPGSLCCASGKEGVIYRALVTRVLESGVEIHLLDRGSTETVAQSAVKELLPRFRGLPALALKCCLAGVSPLRGSWSEASVSAFREIVLNKGLKVCFLSLQGDKYMVEIFDQSQLGEKSVSKLMAQGGCAEYQRCEIPKIVQSSDEKAVTEVSCLASPADEKQINAEKRLGRESALKSSNRALDPFVAMMVRESPVAAVHNSKISDSVSTQGYKGKGNLQAPLTQNYMTITPRYCCGGHLEVGSTVNVILSHVENPSFFWCQLSTNCRYLELLMDEIQEHCKKSSQPHVLPNLVCLAQYSKDKRWYRALIVNEALCAGKVEVVYVDYGNREQVCLTNLRAINEHFLRLEAQAFRCSLYNLIQPNGQNPFVWDEEAIKTFQRFVNASSELELKCTIFALASVNRDLFNIVDLITPFQSACQFMTESGVARYLFPQKHLPPLVQLHSYYYSSHGIKIGSEEDVYITHVEDPWTFYCQLERCADTLEQLAGSISHLSETMTSTGTLGKSASLCLARYADSQWYRGVIVETQPKAKVFFVDFGNTETVEKDDLLPLPSDAADVLLVPMQAIKCCISDVSAVSKEAATWFKEAVLEKHLKAVIVAKDSDNTLLVELFDTNTQINTKLKELSLNSTGLCSHVENETWCITNTDVNERDQIALCPLNVERPLKGKCTSGAQGEQGKKRHFKEYVNISQPSRKGDLADGLLESDEMLSSRKDAILLNKAGEESLISVQMDALSESKSDAEGRCIMLKNLCDLPQQKIAPALKTLVYVSHVNDPLDFYVQLGSDEVQLSSILQSLNTGTPAQIPCGQPFQAGDLISAVYSEDNLWYRAVVKEKTSDNLIRVHYIDYGDTSVISVDQACMLPEDLSSIPAISIHSFLSGLKHKKHTDWGEKTVLSFTKRTSEILLLCEFVEKVQDKWEVILSDHQGRITVDLAGGLASTERSCSTEITDKRENSDVITVCEHLPPQAQEISCDCKSFIWKFPGTGQTLKIYVTVVNGPEYFWCHTADNEYLGYIEKKIEEAEKLGLRALNDGRSCIKSGDPCLAKYSQDGWFYRAQISSVKNNSVVVRHVDYGSEVTVSVEMVRQIPRELLRIPGQAFACCLSGFNPSEGSWLREASQKFYDMTEKLVLEAEVVETREINDFEVPLCVVKLEASGNSINEEMKPFWKANKKTRDSTFSSGDNLLKENKSSNSNVDLCLESKTTAVCGLALEESALLCSEPSLDVTSEDLETAEANVLVRAAGGNADGGYELAEHQNSFDKVIALSKGESDNSVLLESRRSCSPYLLGSEMTASEQGLSEVLFGEDAGLQAELTGSDSAASLFLGDKQEELQELPVLQPQLSSNDGTGTSVKLDPLEIHCSYDDLKELLMDLKALSGKSSLGEETKEALEMQRASGSEARGTVLEQELLDLPISSQETGELTTLNFLEILTLLNEKENLLPSESLLVPSVVQPSLGENTKEENMSGIHQGEDLLGDWMEADPPSLRLTSSSGRSEKEMDLKNHNKQSMLDAKFECFQELMLPDVQPCQEKRKEDLLGLEHAVLQSSANSGSQFSCRTEDSMNWKPVFTGKSYDCRVKVKHKKWLKKNDSLEEWIEQDLTNSFKEYGNMGVQSSGCKSGDEEKQRETLTGCSAAHPDYPCNLKGFAVGSKCVVWTSLQWCEARILEVSEKGTRVLNLSSGNEEIVDPENVWNGIPDSNCRSSEALTSAKENLESLTEESLLNEKQTSCSCELLEDTHALQHC